MSLHEESKSALTKTAALTQRQRQMLQTMGVDVWQSRTAPGKVSLSLSLSPSAKPENEQASASPKNSVSVPETPTAARTNPIEAKADPAANGSKQSAQTVTEAANWSLQGSGNAQSNYWVVCELPASSGGDLQAAGCNKLLDAILFALDLTRSDIFVAICTTGGANVSTIAVSDALKDLMQGHEPDCMILMGEAGARALLNTDKPIAVLRAEQYRLSGGQSKLQITHGLSTLIEQPQLKAEFWQDICKFKKLVKD